jgi:hypothetical protein
MKEFIALVIRSLVVAMLFATIGLGANLLSPNAIPFVYEPRSQIEISGVKVPLVDQHVAHDYFGDPATSFVDTRQPDDYSESHVKGSLGVSPDNLVYNFTDVEPLFPQENRILFYF